MTSSHAATAAASHLVRACADPAAPPPPPAPEATPAATSRALAGPAPVPHRLPPIRGRCRPPPWRRRPTQGIRCIRRSGAPAPAPSSLSRNTVTSSSTSLRETWSRSVGQMSFIHSSGDNCFEEMRPSANAGEVNSFLGPHHTRRVELLCKCDHLVSCCTAIYRSRCTATSPQPSAHSDRTSI